MLTAVAASGSNFAGWTGCDSSTGNSCVVRMSSGRNVSVFFSLPSTVAILTGATALSAGTGHTCTLVSDGTVKCWGDNEFGQIGDGSTTNRLTAVTVSGISGASAVTTAGHHSCALLAGGAVKCWGLNQYGQLGGGTTNTNQLLPVTVAGITGATALAAGEWHTCAVVGGAVRCWGANFTGQLGDGSTTDRLTAVAASGVSGATALAAGDFFSCALITGGAVKCWGYNVDGQLGDGSNVRRLTAVDVASVSGATAVAAGKDHSCAVVAGGLVKCWGNNFYGQLGDGSTTDRPVAVTAVGLSAVNALAAGAWHTCGLLSGGSVRCWGQNNFGQIGDGTTTSRLVAVPVSGIDDANALTAGGFHTCAAVAGGAARCWGQNQRGQLGDGSSTNRPTAVVVTTMSPTGATALLLNRAGDGSGTVSSNPSGISCGSTCAANFSSNASVTLTAVGTNGSIFNGWSGDCAGAQSTCTVTMSQARNVTATFDAASRLLTVIHRGSGAGTVSSNPTGISCGTTCAANFSSNASVTLTAVAASGSTFSGWSFFGCGVQSTCTVTMSEARFVGATFTLIGGEPLAVVNLPLTTGVACAAFYSVQTFGSPGIVPGLTATEITLQSNDRRLVGGLIMKGNVLRTGAFAGVTVPATPGRPSFLAPVVFWLPTDLVGATLRVVTGNTTLLSIRVPARSGAQVLPLVPLGEAGGYFSIRLTPDSGRVFGDRPFAMELGVKFGDGTSAFFDSGTVVGGVIDDANPTEVSFCMAQGQNVQIRTLGSPTYVDGVTNQYFTIRNPQDVVVFDSRN